MTAVLIIFVTAFFSAYAFFDSMAIVSRSSASAVGLNAFGASIEKIMNTLKRLMIFFYPPILGYFVIRGDAQSIFLSIFFSYGCACVIQLFVLFRRVRFAQYFCSVAEQFSEGRSVLQSLKTGWQVPSANAGVVASSEADLAEIPNFGNVISSFRVLIMMASWIYFVFGASIFSLNILAIAYSDFSPIILQLLGLFNGLGTVVLAFFVDPIVSRYLDKSERLGEVTVALLAAQFFSYAIISPFFYLLLLKVSMPF